MYSSLYCVAKTPPENIQVFLWPEAENHVVVLFDPSTSPNAARRRPPSSTDAIAAVKQGLAAGGHIYNLQGTVLLSVGGEYIALEKPPQTKDLLHEKISYLMVNDPSMFDPEEWTARNDSREVSLVNSLHSLDGLRATDDPPQTLCTSLAGAHGRRGIPKAAGILRHPVVGEPSKVYGQWLFDSVDYPDPDTVSDQYPLLQQLFAGLNLSPASHAAVHAYLLAFFHADVLTNPRPILLVDGWEQGRGKSEVGKAIRMILDGDDGEIAFHPQETKLSEQISAQTIQSQSFIVDNIEGVSSWTSNMIAQLSTGTGKDRRKHDREISSIRGAAIVLNLNYGAATLSTDILSRSIRCELTGRAGPLSGVCPPAFAQDNLAGLRAECWAAVLRSQAKIDETLSVSRFPRFDAIGIAAYSEVFKVSLGAAASLLAESNRNAYALHEDVLRDLFASHPDSFLTYSEHATRRRRTSGGGPALRSDWSGVTALGYTLKEEGGKFTWTS